MQCSTRVVSHQDLHLGLGKILDVFIQRARFFFFTIDSAFGLFVLLVAKQFPPLHRNAASGNTMLGRSA